MEKLTRMKLVYLKVYGMSDFESLLEQISYSKKGEEEAHIFQVIDLICDCLIPVARQKCIEQAAEFHMLMDLVKYAKTEGQISRIIYSP